MKAFEYGVPEDTDWITPTLPAVRKFLHDVRFDAGPLLPSWQAPKYHYVDHLRSGMSDFPWDGYGQLCLRAPARNALQDLLSPYGEFLPVELGDGETVWLFRPIGTVAALDLRASAYDPLPPGGIGKITSYVFHDELIADRPVFRIPQRVRPYVTNRFVDRVHEAKLTGLTFKLLWDSEWTVRPVPLLIVSGYWSPRAWDEAESAQRTLTFLTRLADLDPAFTAWRRRGRGPSREQAVAMPLTEKAVAAALKRLRDRDRNADAIYHDGGIWNAPHEEVSLELQQATGTGERFVNSPWGGVAHLRLFDLLETRTAHASPEGVLRLFDAMRTSWPVEHLVARTELFQSHEELKRFPLLGWITWLTAQGRVADRDPVLPDGVQILDRTSRTLTLKLSPTLNDLTAETVQATGQALEEQGWLVRKGS